MKWEPVAAMILLGLLGFWVVYAPKTPHELAPGAETIRFDVGGKGELEILEESDGEYSFRLLYSDRPPPPMDQRISKAEFIRVFGVRTYERVIENAGNDLFRALNITSWAGLAWVALGFLGQGAFFGRMLIQWLVSEKSRKSVVPPIFWWLSLLGGVSTFIYFAWRQDVVGVVGQTMGVVIYARNIRLISKQRRRAEREAARSRPDTVGPSGEAASARAVEVKPRRSAEGPSGEQADNGAVVPVGPAPPGT